MFSHHWQISIFDTLFFDVVCILIIEVLRLLYTCQEQAGFKRMRGTVASGVVRYAHCPGMAAK